MKESIFITLPQKGDLLLYSNHRLIRLMCHITKIILRVLMERIRNKLLPEIDSQPFGFKKGKRTRNAIFAMRTIAESSTEMQKDLYLAYINYEKALTM